MFSMSSGNLSDKIDIVARYCAQYRKRSPIHRKVEGGGPFLWVATLRTKNFTKFESCVKSIMNLI